jgi:hypothetical protein
MTDRPTKTIAERLAIVETKIEYGFQAIEKQLEAIREDLSKEGRPPKPSGTPAGARPRIFGLAPGTGREIALLILGVAGGLGLMGGITWNAKADEPVEVHRVESQPSPPDPRAR